MVLPGRIELTTSPLPRECSTTELRQRKACENAIIPMRKAGDPCHRRGVQRKRAAAYRRPLRRLKARALNRPWSSTAKRRNRRLAAHGCRRLCAKTSSAARRKRAPAARRRVRMAAREIPGRRRRNPTSAAIRARIRRKQRLATPRDLALRLAGAGYI